MADGAIIQKISPENKLTQNFKTDFDPPQICIIKQ